MLTLKWNWGLADYAEYAEYAEYAKYAEYAEHLPIVFSSKDQNIAKGTTDPGVDCFDQ